MEEELWEIPSSFYEEKGTEHKQMQATETLKKLGIKYGETNRWIMRHPISNNQWSGKICIYSYSQSDIRITFKPITNDLESLKEYKDLFLRIRNKEITHILFKSFPERKFSQAPA